MLASRKFNLFAQFKLDGLTLQKQELEFYIMRYYAIAGAASLLVGIAYVGLIKIKFPEQWHHQVEHHAHEYCFLPYLELPHWVPRAELCWRPSCSWMIGEDAHGEGHGEGHDEGHGEGGSGEGHWEVHGEAHGGGHGEAHGHEPFVWPWQISAFFISICCMMCFSLLNLTLTSFLVVGAQNMILRGPPGSLAKSVKILSDYYPHACLSLGAAFVCLFASIMSIQWMKLDDAPGSPASAILCSTIFISVMIATFVQLQRMVEAFAIRDEDLVHGDVTAMGTGGTQQVDLMDTKLI